MNKIQPFIPIHPGALIKDEIEARGITQRKLATIMAIQYTMLNEVLNGKRNVSTELALLFEAALEINAEMLINMQASYNLQVAKKNKTLLDRITAVRQSYAAML